MVPCGCGLDHFADTAFLSSPPHPPCPCQDARFDPAVDDVSIGTAESPSQPPARASTRRWSQLRVSVQGGQLSRRASSLRRASTSFGATPDRGASLWPLLHELILPVHGPEGTVLGVVAALRHRESASPRLGSPLGGRTKSSSTPMQLSPREEQQHHPRDSSEPPLVPTFTPTEETAACVVAATAGVAVSSCIALLQASRAAERLRTRVTTMESEMERAALAIDASETRHQEQTESKARIQARLDKAKARAAKAEAEATARAEEAAALSEEVARLRVANDKADVEHARLSAALREHEDAAARRIERARDATALLSGQGFGGETATAQGQARASD